MGESGSPKTGRASKAQFVLVTGITGQQGGHVARRLVQRGHRVRALSRDPQNPKLAEFRSGGVEVVPGDFDDPSTIERAARGVDAMFLMGTPFRNDAAGETRQGRSAVDAAQRAGVPWLVYSSVSDADHRTGVPHFDSKFAVEEHLRASGVPYAISAPTAFFENFIGPFAIAGVRQGRLAGGLSPDRVVQMVALDDLGFFVTHLLENPTLFRGKRINVASDGVRNSEAARVFSELTGRPFEYQPIPMAALRAQSGDYSKMYEFMENVGYTADIEGLRREYPEVGWHRFREWAAQLDWAKILAGTSP